ncbi:MAG: Histidine kinase-, DNA gyrase B-, and, partial [Candidatus Nomurabacteria bacterium GW2011_GWD2_39_12]
MEQFCPWEQAQYFIYSDNIPTLFFYSHIPAIIIALLVGFLVFYKSNKSGVGVTLLLITLLFSIWSIFDLILWATNRPDIVMFFWSLQILIEPLIYLLGFYLTYLFITNKDLGFKAKLLGLALYSPIVFLLPSAYNLVGVELVYCTAIEGVVAQYFTYIVELVFIISIFVLTDREYRKNISRKREILTFGLGVVAFLLAFSWGNLIGSFTDNWTLAQFGLIGMPIFVAFLAYLIVKFHTFNIKLIATQVLMVSLWFLVLGILFIRNINNVRVVTLFTLFLVTVVGYLLVKSVKKEIERKEELAKLNIELQDSIKQRESLVHLVTHKVKGSFTRSKYIFAGIIDGTFGIVSPSIKKYAEQGLESDNMGIETVDLVLNADNLQKGTVKYDMKSIDFKEIVLKAIEEKRGPIEMKGLKIENTIKDGNYTILGDTFWLKEAVHNLIENSIQYTKTGGIVVGLSDGNGKVVLSVKDTGVGINDEDKKSLFTEGGR